MDGQGFEVIYLNDLPYYCTNEEYQQLATLLGKVSFGDYTKDSDMLISSKIYSSFSGGGQVDRTAKEGADDGRFWFGDMQTTYPNQLGLADEVRNLEGMAFILGDLGSTLYGVGEDNKLYSISDFVTTDLGALDDDPVYRGYEFQGKLFIPQGSAGYQTWDGATLSAQVTTVQAICFAEWDNKLYALCANHKIQSTTDGSTWSDRYTFNSSIVPKRLTKYMNAGEEDTLYFSSNKGLSAWDESTQTVVTTRIYGPEAFPPHPDNGEGLAMWKTGEDLFMSVGLDVIRWNINAASPVQSGLGRDEGLPVQYRGKIVDLIPGHRYMYALTQGISEVSTPDTSGDDEFDTGMIDEGEFSASATEPENLVMGWNGLGWHAIAAPTEAGVPTWLTISQAGSETRLWWTVDSSAYTILINRAFLNLRSRIAASEGRFQSRGTIELARFDAGKMMFDKIMSHVEIYMSYWAGLETHQWPIQYKTDRHDWYGLGGVGSDNAVPNADNEIFSILPFGLETLPDGNGFARGEVMRWVKFRFNPATYDVTTTPLMDFMTLKYITRPLQNSTFSLHIPLNCPRAMGDAQGRPRGPQTIKEELDNLAASPGFVRLTHNGMSENQRSHRVYLSRVTGNNSTGMSPNGMRIVSLVQIPMPGWEGNELFHGAG
jgi:hypothetical protein